jgi:hypothetical protein
MDLPLDDIIFYSLILAVIIVVQFGHQILDVSEIGRKVLILVLAIDVLLVGLRGEGLLLRGILEVVVAEYILIVV